MLGLLLLVHKLVTERMYMQKPDTENKKKMNCEHDTTAKRWNLFTQQKVLRGRNEKGNERMHEAIK